MPVIDPSSAPSLAPNPMNSPTHPTASTSLSRRGALGALAAAACAGPTAWAIEPLRRQGPAALKLSLAAYSFRDRLPNHRSGKPDPKAAMDMPGFIDYCAERKLDGVELTSYFLPHPCPPELADRLKARAVEKGLAISGGAIGNTFALPPGPELDRQLAYTREWVEAYARMGAPVIRVFAGQPAKGLDPATAEKHIIENLQKACDGLKDKGVVLAVENHDFTTDIDRLLRIVRAVNSPIFAVNLDSGNLARTADPYADLARLAPYAANVQFKAMIPRDGKKEPADFKRLVKIVRDAGYRGFIVLEYEEREAPETAVPRLLGQLREAIG